MKIIKPTILVVITLLILVFAVHTFAQSAGSSVGDTGLVPCTDNCTTRDFFLLISKIVNYFVFILAVPVATIAIAYAGLMLASHPAEEGKRTEAKQILHTVVVGLALVLGAWLIVTTLFNYLAKPELQSRINQIVPNGR